MSGFIWCGNCKHRLYHVLERLKEFEYLLIVHRVSHRCNSFDIVCVRMFGDDTWKFHNVFSTLITVCKNGASLLKVRYALMNMNEKNDKKSAQIVCILICFCCCRTCQTNDWQQRHRTQCRLLPELIAEPFLLSIPASQATYSRLVQMLEAFSRYTLLSTDHCLISITTGTEK